jgi:rRNA maturation endonuclease Nob1
LEVKVCPLCGGEVGIFSDKYEASCPTCGSELFRDLASCIDWCSHAKRCLDEGSEKKAVLTLK